MSSNNIESIKKIYSWFAENQVAIKVKVTYVPNYSGNFIIENVTNLSNIQLCWLLLITGDGGDTLRSPRCESESECEGHTHSKSFQKDLKQLFITIEIETHHNMFQIDK